MKKKSEQPPPSTEGELLQIATDLKRHLIRQMPRFPYGGRFVLKAEPDAFVPVREQAPAEATSLDMLREMLRDCTRCNLHQKRNRIVFGQGNPHARLMFIGEGPGAEEDRQGLPFVGRAGQLLTRIIAAIGLKREEVYITNIVKCRPPGNRDPRPDEIITCLPFLKQQIRLIRPSILCTLGSPATKTVLQTDAPISRLRGRFHEMDGIPVMPTYHPAYLLRNPAQKRPVWEDMQKVQRMYLEND